MIEIGDNIGNLVVIGSAAPYVSPSGFKHAKWLCKCSCGNKKEIRESSLRSGDTKSCGCLAKKIAGDRLRTHGLSGHPLRNVWYDMVRRCYDSSRKDYKHYGGRGIEVCDQWRGEKGCEKFIEDMFPTFVKGLELERIDVNGDYTPSNCTWVTRREQVINRRPIDSSFDTHYITHNGRTLCISQWADESGIPYKVLIDRLGKLKWNPAKAFSTPCKVRVVLIEYKGVVYKSSDFVKCPPNVHSKARVRGFSFQQYIANLLCGKAKVMAVYSGVNVEVKPTADLSENIAEVVWNIDLTETKELNYETKSTQS